MAVPVRVGAPVHLQGLLRGRGERREREQQGSHAACGRALHQEALLDRGVDVEPGRGVEREGDRIFGQLGVLRRRREQGTDVVDLGREVRAGERAYPDPA